MYRALFDKEGVNSCYQCGKCSSGCDINRLDHSFRPHRLLRLISKGEVEALLGSADLWKCTTCFICSERCPQGIKVAEILWIARAMLAGSGAMPVPVALQREAVLRTGRLIPLDRKKREKAGLPFLTEESPVAAEIVALIKGRGMVE